MHSHADENIQSLSYGCLYCNSRSTLHVIILSHFSNQWHAVVHLSAPDIDIYMVSMYFKFDDLIGNHIDRISFTVDALKEKNLILITLYKMKRRLTS